MIDLSDNLLLVILPACLAGGGLLGWLYFHSIRMTADLLVSGERPVLAVALTLGRFAGLGAGFYAAVLVGGLALLAAFAGVLIAKFMILRGTRGASV